MLIRHACLAEWQPVVIEHLRRLGDKRITELCRLQVCYAVLHTQGNWTMGISNSSKGKVGKSEVYPTLTDTGSIEMMFLNNAGSTGKALTDFCQLHAILCRKPVTGI